MLKESRLVWQTISQTTLKQKSSCHNQVTNRWRNARKTAIMWLVGGGMKMRSKEMPPASILSLPLFQRHSLEFSPWFKRRSDGSLDQRWVT